MGEKIKELITALIKGLIFFRDYLSHVYLDYWLSVWVIVPTAVLIYLFFTSMSNCHFYYKPKSLWETLFMELSLNVPGARRRRIKFLRKNVFPDWIRTLKGRKSFYEVGEWNGKDFAKAYLSGDIKKLSEMCKIIGPWWNFWIVRPVLAFLAAVTIPFFVLTFFVLILFYGIFLFFSAKCPSL